MFFAGGVPGPPGAVAGSPCIVECTLGFVKAVLVLSAYLSGHRSMINGNALS